MKNLNKVFTFLAIVLIGLTSCELDSLTKGISFTSQYIKDINVDVPAVKGSATFTKTESVDPLGDDQMNKYAAQIDSIKITKLTATLTSISKPVVISNCVIEFTSGNVTISYPIESMSLVVGSSISLSDTDGKWALIRAFYESKQKFDITLKGTVSDTDVNFVVSVLIETKTTTSAD